VKEFGKSASQYLTKLCVDYVGLLFWPTLHVPMTDVSLVKICRIFFKLCWTDGWSDAWTDRRTATEHTLPNILQFRTHYVGWRHNFRLKAVRLDRKYHIRTKRKHTHVCNDCKRRIAVK